MKILAILLTFLSCLNCSRNVTAKSPKPPGEPVVVVHDGAYPGVREWVVGADIMGVASGAAKLAGVEAVQVFDCGFVNAFYWSEGKAVVLCSEMVYFLSRTLGAEYMAPVLRFVVLHEMGHALVDHLKIPLSVYEESVVDQFSALWLLANGRQADLVAAMKWFDLLTALGAEDDPTDPHLSPERRKQDVLCLVLGYAPEDNLSLTVSLGLSVYKAFSCGRAYLEALAYWESVGVHPAPGTP